MKFADLPENFRRAQGYIDGQWQDSTKDFSVFCPATGEELVRVAEMGADEAKLAVAAADKAFSLWRTKSVAERVQLIRKWAQLIRSHSEVLGHLLTYEQGKPLSESIGEWEHGANCLEWYAAEAERVHGATLPVQQGDQRNITILQPVGVMAAITPWNFPAVSILVKCGAAIASGCTVVLKPSEQTPLCATALGDLASNAGLPAGVFNVLPAHDPQPVGDVLTKDPRVKMLSFTGSTAVGRKLSAQVAPTLKKVAMELGGNAPFIVFEDADLEKAAEALIGARFYNNGQICIGANRVFVQGSVEQDFLQILKAKISAITTGNGLLGSFQCGPMIDEKAILKVENLVADAVTKGAKIVVGGRRLEEGRLFYQPTLLSGCTSDMSLAEEEIFGPVAAVYSFDSEEEVLKEANSSSAGLGAYFYSSSMSRCWRVAESLEVGMVGCNTATIALLDLPFGGIKESGNGREGGLNCLEEYMEIKSISFGI